MGIINFCIICLDKLTYAGNLSTLAPVMDNPNFRFVKADICDREAVDKLFEEEHPDIVVNFAAESHVDRSIEDPGIFLQTNIIGTSVLMSTKGVLRGLHFQKQYPQCKLVRAVRGTVFDVAVDLRSNSETYGKWYGVTLSAENKKQFLIPEGFAHGFLVLSDEAEFCYKVNDFWHPNDEGGMAWNDPEIGIEWPELKGEYKGSASAEGYTLKDGTALNLSDKDQKWLGLKDTFKF